MRSTSGSTGNDHSFLLRKEVFVQPFELDCAARSHSHSMFDHEVSEDLSINKDDALGQMSNKLSGLSAEG